MAWNEPGGNKDQDPWGKRGNNQGPPDLEEVFRKFQEKITGLFGGGSGRGGRSSSNMPSSSGIIIILVILGLVWLASGTYKIGAAERGVVLRFGKHAYSVGSGLHWHIPYPVEKVLKVDTSNVQNYSHHATMLTQDQNIIDIEITVQYRANNAEDYFFNLREPEFTLKEASVSALRQHVGRSTMDYLFGEGREEISLNVAKTIQEILDQYQSGMIVERVNMQEAKPPEQVKSAFDDVTQAEEDEVRLKNQAESYYNEILPQARGTSAKMLEEANAYKQEVISRAEGDAKRFTKILAEYNKAPRVTRDRLYIEAVETVLANTSKVMVDIKGGNNLMYLPLDKLIGSNTTSNKITSSALEKASRAIENANRNRGLPQSDFRSRVATRLRENR